MSQIVQLSCLLLHQLCQLWQNFDILNFRLYRIAVNGLLTIPGRQLWVRLMHMYDYWSVEASPIFLIFHAINDTWLDLEGGRLTSPLVLLPRFIDLNRRASDVWGKRNWVGNNHSDTHADMWGKRNWVRNNHSDTHADMWGKRNWVRNNHSDTHASWTIGLLATPLPAYVCVP